MILAVIKGNSSLICLSFGDRDRGRLPYYCAKNIPGRLLGSGRFRSSGQNGYLGAYSGVGA